MPVREPTVEWRGLMSHGGVRKRFVGVVLIASGAVVTAGCSSTTKLEADSPAQVEPNAESVNVIDSGNHQIQWLRRYVDTSAPPPTPAVVCPQAITYTPAAGTSPLADPAHMTTAEGLGVLVSGRGSHDAVRLSPSITQPTYAPLPTGPTTPDLSQISLPGAIAANNHWDLFIIDTATGQLHHTRYQVATA